MEREDLNKNKKERLSVFVKLICLENKTVKMLPVTQVITQPVSTLSALSFQNTVNSHYLDLAYLE